MTKKYFGTDGIRGVTNRTLTTEFVFQLGLAVGAYVQTHDHSPKVIMGWDTRQSCTMFANALASSLNSMGVEVHMVGVIPTGGISYLTRSQGYGLGIMVSASHNPAQDNGIKLFSHTGNKFSDDQELQVEALIGKITHRVEPNEVGTTLWKTELNTTYEDYLVSLLPEKLENWTIALDTAHGAAYKVAPQVLKRLGAQVIIKGDQPNGKNINQNVGATHLATLQTLIQTSNAIVGIAFDGDADRAVFVDQKGRVLNGDHIMALWSVYQVQKGKLTPNRVIGTVMSNGGIEKYLAEHNIELYRAPVGDKYVSQAIQQHSAKIGGEQSGHLIFSHHAPTGDGLITMLEILRVLRQNGHNLNHFCDTYQPWPQMTVNVKYCSSKNWREDHDLQTALSYAQDKMADKGRVFLRASGTQPILRLMVEAQTESMRDDCLEALLPVLLNTVSGEIYSTVDLTHSLGE